VHVVPVQPWPGAIHEMKLEMFLIQGTALRSRNSVPIQHCSQIAPVDMRQRIQPVDARDLVFQFDVVQAAGRQNKSHIPISPRQLQTRPVNLAE